VKDIEVVVNGSLTTACKCVRIGGALRGRNMKHSQETFLQLVKEAYEGSLQLPAFQRAWRWERSKVISLYDSLRKQFPIGSFLLLETSPEYDLSPRPYQGSNAKLKAVRLTLDGQQRITSGIILLHGAQDSARYFLDLRAIRKLAESTKPDGLDYRDEEKVKKFVQDLDDQDDYMIGTSRKTELNTMLLQDHLLSSTCLASKVSMQKSLEEYENRYPETREFNKYVIVPYFTLENTSNHPVTTLTSSESLSAVTKIFATINTTGKRLPPFEIVTAILYAHDIDLKLNVQVYREASDYLSNMDKDGEVLLQTIALLANESPKKSSLPKTIDYERFKRHCDDALTLLDRVGEFLSSELGVGLKYTDKLIPYVSILAPMAVCFKEIMVLEGKAKSKAYEKMQKWFIGAAVGQRYIQGAGTKQETDAKEMTEWVKRDSDELKPKWLSDVHVNEALIEAPASGAIGNLVRCLLNSKKPVDLLQGTKVGYYELADECPEEHHIWPKKFCTQYVSGWDKGKDTTEHALNIIPVSCKTNKRWAIMDPKNQVDDIKATIKNAAKRKETLGKLLISDECIRILERPKKTKKDYSDFLAARFKVLSGELMKLDFTPGEEEYEEEAGVSDESS
jgi:hypothetical protein